MPIPKVSLTAKIFIGLILGIFIGWLFPSIGLEARPLSNLFLNLIKCIIAPLVFATLVIGISGTGDMKQVGRIGAKSLIYFEIVTTLALVIGLIAVNIAQPGKGLSLSSVEKKENKKDLADRAVVLASQAKEAANQAKTNLQNDNSTEAIEQTNEAATLSSEATEVLGRALVASEPTAKPQSLGDIIEHLAPSSIIKAMAAGDVLQIVVFSVLFALAVTSIGKEKSEPIVRWCESLADVMFRFTEFVMKFAPIGVGAAMAYTVSHSGLEVLRNLAMLVGTLYVALLVLCLLVLLPIALFFRVPLRDFYNAVKTPAVIAFATTSSESALPKAMENLVKLGCPKRIVGFVLPTGYSFNLDGTTLYLAVASIFVAQAAGIELSWTQQIFMMLTLMLTSKGVAGVPRASLVILLGTLASFNLPVEGVILILGVDELMDMARTAVNVIGNCLATVVITKWEGAFRNEEWQKEMAEARQEPAHAGL
jgi:proton glutamate symport protein